MWNLKCFLCIFPVRLVNCYKGHIIICIYLITVPAAILSFSTTKSAPWKTDISFHCRYVGNPRPELSWIFNSNKVQVGPHLAVLSNGTLHIRSVTPSDAGNYSCHVQNIHHAESLVHVLRVLGKFIKYCISIHIWREKFLPGLGSKYRSPAILVPFTTIILSVHRKRNWD